MWVAVFVPRPQRQPPQGAAGNVLSQAVRRSSHGRRPSNGPRSSGDRGGLAHWPAPAQHVGSMIEEGAAGPCAPSTTAPTAIGAQDAPGRLAPANPPAHPALRVDRGRGERPDSVPMKGPPASTPTGRSCPTGRARRSAAMSERACKPTPRTDCGATRQEPPPPTKKPACAKARRATTPSGGPAGQGKAHG